jgi:hypothetical protein
MVYGVYVAAPYGDVIHNWPYAARKRTGDAENGWRPPPDKNIEPVPHWGKKNSPQKCLVYLGRATQWALRPRRLVRREDAR